MNSSTVTLCFGVILLSWIGLGAPVDPGKTWPLWESYTARFLDSQGRLIDRGSEDRTTSEAQAYGMFFALVANDRKRFDLLAKWTADNLADGDLGANLSAWLWGKSQQQGDWRIQDTNSAADADLWIAFTLCEAGKHWSEPRFSELGTRLATQIARQEVTDMGRFGPMLLPAGRGFQPKQDSFVLNPSYVPIQLLLALSVYHPSGPWKQIAERVPRLIKRSSPRGFVLDWITLRANGGFVAQGPAGNKPLASYDAIRVYLWAGMLDPQTAGRREILEATRGMAEYLRKTPLPPAEVTAEGRIKNRNGSVGFSAALIPFLSSVGDQRGVHEQKLRLEAARDAGTGLYGVPPRYYDQCLALFSTGWSDGRYSFASDGSLKLRWR